MSTYLVRRAFVLATSTFIALTAAGLVAFASVPAAAASDPPATWGTFGPVGFGDMAFGSDGSIYTPDCGNARIYRVLPDGTVTVFAGAGDGGFDNGYSGDGGPALAAHFGCPISVISDGSRGLLVTDHLNDVIRRIDSHGIVSTVAGTGPLFKWSHGAWVPGIGKHAGDGGPATDAVLDAPWGIERDPRGRLFIADRDHDAIRMVDPSGIITTVAGTGVRGDGHDGQQATATRLNRVLDVAFGSDGSWYIADENNARIRRVDPSGLVSTFAGTGHLGCTGVDGPASSAPMQNANYIGFAPGGALYVAQPECHRISAVGADGILRVVVGTGEDACAGLDGGRAVDAGVSDPDTLEFDHGTLYFTACGRILRLDGQGRLHVVADATTAGD